MTPGPELPPRGSAADRTPAETSPGPTAGDRSPGDRGPHARTPARGRRTASPEDVARWVLAALLPLLVVALVVVGERPRTLDDLQQAVRSGDVTSVRIAGRLDPGETGFAQQRASWRDGLLRGTVDVLHAPAGTDPSGTGLGGTTTTPVVREDLGAVLRALAPDLRVEREQGVDAGGEVMGWRAPTALVLLWLVGALATLWLLVNGPQPQRATRWAWFWVLGTPVGALAFLLLSGPTPGLPAPDPSARRMTGGTGLVVGLLLSAVLPSAL